MCQDSQQALAFLGGVVTGPQRRVQPSLVPRDHALHLPAIPVDSLVESALHLATILCFGPAPCGVTPVQRNDRTAYAQLLSAQPMIGLAVVARIGREAGQAHVADRLPHRRSKLRAVIAGAGNHNSACNQVALRVADDRQLGPAAAAKPLVSLAIHEVGADVMGLQAGRVDGTLGLGGDQAALGCPLEEDMREPVESPFFISRPSA